jgi:cardiolipin synthase
MPHLPVLPNSLKAALSIAWTVYIAIMAIWIVWQKRSPIVTLGWILSLAWLPLVGFVVYYFFGPQRMRRQRLRRVRSQAQLYAHTDLKSLLEQRGDTPAHLKQLSVLARNCCDLPVSTATDVRLLVDGGQTYDAIFLAISQAERHVHLEYYIFNPDQIGTALRDLLVEKARAGVEVRLLVDALGSKALHERFFRPLREAGGEIGLFHGSRIGRRLRPVINFRTHRKIVVCDGRIGFTGGLNITDEEDERCRADAYHDVHLRLEGGVVRWLQTVFMEDWAYATRDRKHRTQEEFADLLPAGETGPHAVQIITSGPDSEREAIHRIFVAAIHVASRRIWITTPYFVPTPATLMALSNAALRGVDVRLLVPRRSDSRIVSAAARSYFDELIAVGVKVWEYEARMLHSKTLLVDDDYAMVGSANFDNRSFRLNYEICAAAYGDVLTVPLGAQFEHDLRQATRVPLNRKQAVWQRLFDAVARLFSPVL